MLFFVLACEDNITSEQEDGHNHDDHDHSSDTIFTPLAPPENGFQLRFGPMEIPPNSEREVFQYTDIGHSEDIYVNRVEIEMRPGSHHFIIYSAKKILIVLSRLVDMIHLIEWFSKF